MLHWLLFLYPVFVLVTIACLPGVVVKALQVLAHTPLLEVESLESAGFAVEQIQVCCSGWI